VFALVYLIHNMRAQSAQCPMRGQGKDDVDPVTIGRASLKP